MKDLIVITGSTLSPDDPRTGTLKLYLNQLEKAGIESYVKYLSKMPQAEGGAPGTLEYFIGAIRELCQQFANYERLVLTDGWDVVFFGRKEDVLRKIPIDRCLIGAAKECYPWGVAAREPTDKDTNRLYANGGLIAGSPTSLLSLADAMEQHPKYRARFENQGMMNVMLAEGTDAFHYDNHTELFFTLYDGYPELDFEHGVPVNKLCGTNPHFLHSNGHWQTEEMWEKYKRSL